MKTAKWLRIETLEETKTISKELCITREKKENIDALLAQLVYFDDRVL